MYMAIFMLGVWTGALVSMGLMAILSVASNSDDQLERHLRRAEFEKATAEPSVATPPSETATAEPRQEPVRRMSHGEMVQIQVESEALRKERGEVK